VVSPPLLRALAPVLGTGLVAALPVAWLTWRRHRGTAAFASPELTNPTDLKVALGFGAAYAVILLAAAWLNDVAGMRGLYSLAFVSGLTDVDAISLSAMRLFGEAKLSAAEAASAIVVAVCANILVKAGIAFTAGGSALGRRCVAGFAVIALALGGASAFMAA
jgi:uncharacterized membrane protein (DUF4010 family)